MRVIQEERRQFREEIRSEIERNRSGREYGRSVETARKFTAEIRLDATRLWNAIGMTAKVTHGDGRGKS